MHRSAGKPFVINVSKLPGAHRENAVSRPPPKKNGAARGRPVVYSPMLIRLALPPAAVVLTLSARSTTKRCRL